MVNDELIINIILIVFVFKHILFNAMLFFYFQAMEYS